MDLSEPLAAVMPRLHARVVRALANNTGWATGGQVHRMAGMGSDNGVRRVLAILVDQGLVLTEQAGRAGLYRLNTEHVLYEPLTRMSSVRAEIVERIGSEIESWSAAGAVPVWHASLFGSFARGEAGAHSDVDILVVIDPTSGVDLADERWALQTATLSGHIKAWTGNAGQVLDTDEAGLRDLLATQDPLVDSWRTDTVHLTGAPLPRMLREVRARNNMPLLSPVGVR
jgi:predicted nucleotidyltransferase